MNNLLKLCLLLSILVLPKTYAADLGEACDSDSDCTGSFSCQQSSPAQVKEPEFNDFDYAKMLSALNPRRGETVELDDPEDYGQMDLDIPDVTKKILRYYANTKADVAYPGMPEGEDTYYHVINNHCALTDENCLEIKRSAMTIIMDNLWGYHSSKDQINKTNISCNDDSTSNDFSEYKCPSMDCGSSGKCEQPPKVCSCTPEGGIPADYGDAPCCLSGSYQVPDTNQCLSAWLPITPFLHEATVDETSCVIQFNTSQDFKDFMGDMSFHNYVAGNFLILLAVEGLFINPKHDTALRWSGFGEGVKRNNQWMKQKLAQVLKDARIHATSVYNEKIQTLLDAKGGMQGIASDQTKILDNTIETINAVLAFEEAYLWGPNGNDGLAHLVVSSEILEATNADADSATESDLVQSSVRTQGKNSEAHRSELNDIIPAGGTIEELYMGYYNIPFSWDYNKNVRGKPSGERSIKSDDKFSVERSGTNKKGSRAWQWKFKQTKGWNDYFMDMPFADNYDPKSFGDKVSGYDNWYRKTDYTNDIEEVHKRETKEWLEKEFTDEATGQVVFPTFMMTSTGGSADAILLVQQYAWDLAYRYSQKNDSESSTYQARYRHPVKKRFTDFFPVVGAVLQENAHYLATLASAHAKQAECISKQDPENDDDDGDETPTDDDGGTPEEDNNTAEVVGGDAHDPGNDSVVDPKNVGDISGNAGFGVDGGVGVTGGGITGGGVGETGVGATSGNLAKNEALANAINKQGEAAKRLRKKLEKLNPNKKLPSGRNPLSTASRLGKLASAIGNKSGTSTLGNFSADDLPSAEDMGLGDTSADDTPPGWGDANQGATSGGEGATNFSGISNGGDDSTNYSGMSDKSMKKMMKAIDKDKKKFAPSKRDGIWAKVTKAYINYGYKRLFSKRRRGKKRRK